MWEMVDSISRFVGERPTGTVGATCTFLFQMHVFRNVTRSTDLNKYLIFQFFKTTLGVITATLKKIRDRR